MNPSGSLPAPIDVFYIVQALDLPGRREHVVASILYETRQHAEVELARLCAADYGKYSIWKGTTYIEPPQWGHPLMRADGVIVPASSRPR